MLSNESSTEKLKNIEESCEIDGLVQHVTNIVALLKMDNSSAETFINEKKPNQIQKEINQLDKDLDKLSPETMAHLMRNGFKPQSLAKAMNIPYIRDKTNPDRNLIQGQMKLIFDEYPDLTQGDLKEICQIMLNESNYEAKNLKTAAYNMVKHITPAY